MLTRIIASHAEGTALSINRLFDSLHWFERSVRFALLFTMDGTAGDGMKTKIDTASGKPLEFPALEHLDGLPSRRDRKAFEVRSITVQRDIVERRLRDLSGSARRLVDSFNRHGLRIPTELTALEKALGDAQLSGGGRHWAAFQFYNLKRDDFRKVVERSKAILALIGSLPSIVAVPRIRRSEVAGTGEEYLSQWYVVVIGRPGEMQLQPICFVVGSEEEIAGGIRLINGHLPEGSFLSAMREPKGSDSNGSMRRLGLIDHQIKSFLSVRTQRVVDVDEKAGEFFDIEGTAIALCRSRWEFFLPTLDGTSERQMHNALLFRSLMFEDPSFEDEFQAIEQCLWESKRGVITPVAAQSVPPPTREQPPIDEAVVIAETLVTGDLSNLGCPALAVLNRAKAYDKASAMDRKSFLAALGLPTTYSSETLSRQLQALSDKRRRLIETTGGSRPTRYLTELGRKVAAKVAELEAVRGKVAETTLPK